MEDDKNDNVIDIMKYLERNPKCERERKIKFNCDLGHLKDEEIDYSNGIFKMIYSIFQRTINRSLNKEQTAFRNKYEQAQKIAQRVMLRYESTLFSLDSLLDTEPQLIREEEAQLSRYKTDLQQSKSIDDFYETILLADGGCRLLEWMVHNIAIDGNHPKQLEAVIVYMHLLTNPEKVIDVGIEKMRNRYQKITAVPQAEALYNTGVL